MSYIVTGGCGFIGSNFVNHLCDVTDKTVFIIDKMTYAADEANIDLDHFRSGQVRVYKCDLGFGCKALDDILQHNNIEGVFNFAAESHVDNSIAGPRVFVESNIVGTFNLLESIRKYSPDSRTLHVSTDEVYGALTEDGPSFTENTLIEPNNVYSATKASAEMLVRSYHKTYGLDVITTRCCNNYGPRAHAEKLIPKVITNALNDLPIPVYGKGDNVREWIYVTDHCRAIKEIFDKGQVSEVYNIGSGIEIKNLDLVKQVLTTLDKPYSLIKFVDDRLGHDFRYSIDSRKFVNLMGGNFDVKEIKEGLELTIQWYKDKHSA